MILAMRGPPTELTSNAIHSPAFPNGGEDHGKAQGGIARQTPAGSITQRRRGSPPRPINPLRIPTSDGQSSLREFTQNKQVPQIHKQYKRCRGATKTTREKPSPISDPISPGQSGSAVRPPGGSAQDILRVAVWAGRPPLRGRPPVWRGTTTAKLVPVVRIRASVCLL